MLLSKETLIILVAGFPFFTGLLLASFINVSKSGKPVVSTWLRRTVRALYLVFGVVWIAAAFFGLFGAYLGIPDKLGWNYFASAILMLICVNGSKGKVLRDEA